MIIPVAHGAAFAGIRNGVLAITPPDYEWPIPGAMMASYRTGRDAFAVTGSPAFPAGLNLGSQLHAIDALFPGAIAEATLLPYAQYWAWLLSGVAVSEVTSLGCHSDLWSPAAACFSPMARRRGWAERFAPLAVAGDVIGTLLPELAAHTGLSPDVRVYAGLHDSNAALLAARGFAEVAGREATVLSTGTWFVAMRTPGRTRARSISPCLPEARDCLVNVDACGQPVPSARFMGGREIALLGAVDRPRRDCGGCRGARQRCHGTADACARLRTLPGPFPSLDMRTGSILRQHSAAVALYAALMTDAALGLIGACEQLVIEGRFAASDVFTRALAALRPGMAVWCAPGETDASFGALRLIVPELAPPGNLRRIDPLPGDLAAYRAAWRKHLGEIT